MDDDEEQKEVTQPEDEEEAQFLNFNNGKEANQTSENLQESDLFKDSDYD